MEKEKMMNEDNPDKTRKWEVCNLLSKSEKVGLMKSCCYYHVILPKSNAFKRYRQNGRQCRLIRLLLLILVYPDHPV